MQLGDRCRQTKDQKPAMVIGESKFEKDGCKVVLLDEGKVVDLKPGAVVGPDDSVRPSVMPVFNVDPQRLTKADVRSAVFQGNMFTLVVLAVLGLVYALLNAR